MEAIVQIGVYQNAKMLYNPSYGNKNVVEIQTQTFGEKIARSNFLA